jgi:5-methylcytosine-specific restriction endonuclease McrA
MKRGGPLRRRAPLRAKTELRRSSALRQRSQRAEAEAMPETIRRAVWVLAGGRCEARLDGCSDEGLAPHHRLRRSQGGPHTIENLVLLCWRCHRWVHDHTGWAYRVGLLIRRAAGPPPERWSRARLEG